MSSFAQLSAHERQERLAQEQKQHESFVQSGLSLNMARGKPSAEQLDLSLPMLDIVTSTDDIHAEDGTDCRNYGVLRGIPEARRLMAYLLDDIPERVIVCGNSSLTIMYDAIARYWMFGALGSTPWGKLDEVKWLCPCPGYDRHFDITESFGIKMIPVDMTPEGPDMDQVEALVANDPSIKGMWCVPTYSNPSGVTFSSETVTRLARMTTAAPDFRIFWDNAYCVHHLYKDAPHQQHVDDIAKACRDAGSANRVLKFASTSKVTFAGGGIAALAASEENLEEIAHYMNVQMIGHDKINQLRHARFLRNPEGLAEHMAKHAEIIKPKFDLVVRMLKSELADVACTWSEPQGGYFILFEGPDHTAKRVVELARQAGVVLTQAGSPFPYRFDPQDKYLRIAPTLPSLEELEVALEVFCCCVRLATLEAIEN